MGEVRVVRKLIARFKDRHGQNDMVAIATMIVSTVVVAIIGVYIASQVYGASNVDTSSPFYTSMQAAITIMNTTFPLLVVVAIAIIAGVIMAYLLGGFGAAGRRE
ncbi:MAG TPA: hypothetical protein ENF26_03330 [Methanomicrobia archaeon]|nr:hypothetical protein [Methanomicrobia archaeon]HEX59163.1 hypothetical protein [Methanomicrobia archaeon]